MVSFIFGKSAARQIVFYLLQIRTLSQTTDDTVGKMKQAESLHIFVSLEDQIKINCNSVCHICVQKYYDPYHQMKMNKCCRNVQMEPSKVWKTKWYFWPKQQYTFKTLPSSLVSFSLRNFLWILIHREYC